MTLGELKQYAMEMCEEYVAPPTGYNDAESFYNFTSDSDLDLKLVPAINSVFGEIAIYIPLVKSVLLTPIYGEVAIPSGAKQVKRCEAEGRSVEFIQTDEFLKFAKDYSEVLVTYEKVPTMFFSSTPNSTILEFTDDVCMAAIYGVCSDLLKISGDYEMFESKYQMRLAKLTPPKKIQFVNLHGGRWGGRI